ncbi:MAG: PTS sugar transporter subunit IIB [Lactobacillus panisapium]|uniref:PTS sugar transporter subunit IIB n=1 Tax=Lactobacillus TaxID=1578 RepID=UPI001C6A3F9F|nr:MULTISPECIES: PTS sugar transporter subunit IIB [Lactobacillus]MCX8724207.1 PTS sugar transporter subunit IIB [Lactobacillus sp. B4005]QYN55666.1 PTS sugar transporter subunit IIB [Lactobacillus panisapium]
MIKMLRVDYRLVHGQVAFAWTNFLSADAILLANDAVAKDDFRKRVLNLAKPNGVKLIFKSIDDSLAAIKSGVTEKYKVFIVVENIQDAYLMAKGTDEIKLIDIGLAAERENTKNIAKSVYVNNQEIEQMTELVNQGVEVVVKQAPTDRDVQFTSLIKKG